MLIIEGTDGVGKTTLCRRLLAGLPGHRYGHMSRPPAGFDHHWGYVALAAPDLVQDRFHMGDVAYAHARGEPPSLTPDRYAMVDAALRPLGSFVVVVTADEGLVRARWTPDQMYDLGRTLAAGRAFLDVASRPDWYRADVDCHLHCDAGRPYVDDDQVDEVLSRYRERRRVVAEVLSRRPAGLQGPGVLAAGG